MSYIIKNYNNTTVRITTLVQKQRDMKNTKHMKFDNRFRPIVPTSPTIEWLHSFLLFFLLFKVRVITFSRLQLLFKYYVLAYTITLESLALATIPFIIPNNNLIKCNLLVILPSSLS